jgi:hypothetical protein
MYYICPLCLYTLGSWSSCENCTVADEYNEKCRLCNPCSVHRGYAVTIKDCNSCLEEVCDSHVRDFCAQTATMINAISGKILIPV